MKSFCLTKLELCDIIIIVKERSALKMKIRWNNVLLALSVLITSLFAVWIIASVINTDLHNSITNDNYLQFAKWNLFTMLNLS